MTLQKTVVREDLEKGKTQVTATGTFTQSPKRCYQRQPWHAASELWKSVQEGKSWRDIVWFAIWNISRFTLQEHKAESWLQPTHWNLYFHKGSPFMFWNSSGRKLDSLDILLHTAFSHAVPHFQVVPTTIILNFSHYCFCSNILILPAFNISRP